VKLESTLGPFVNERAV